MAEREEILCFVTQSLQACRHETEANCQVRDEVEDSSAEEIRFNIIKWNKRATKTTPKGKNKQAGRQAGRQAEDWSTVKHESHMT